MNQLGGSEALKSKINRYVGTTRRFNYPRQFTSLPGYTAHRGCTVTVLRRLPDAEVDPCNQPMYEVKALRDGWIGHAWPCELGRSVQPKVATP